MGEFTIKLKDLQFYSFHGVYEEEKKTGGEFSVDLHVKYFTNDHEVRSIKETVNYVSLYEIVKTEMGQPKELLEILAQSIAEKIHTTFPLVKEINIRIEKRHPPIVGFMGAVAVSYRKVF